MAEKVQFLELLKIVQGNKLKDAFIVKHEDARGGYESIALEFQSDHGDVASITLTSNYEISNRDRDIIDTNIDVESARMVVDTLEKK